MMRKKLIIFGAGGLGREVKTIVDALPEWEPIGFCDDHVAVGKTIMGLSLLGDRRYLHTVRDVSVVVAIGDPNVKRSVVKQIERESDVKFATLIHPAAILGDRATITVGEGSIITAGCVLTTSITIGNHVLINLNSTVGHDTSIGDYASIMPGVNLAGEVTIEESVMVGSGVNVLNRITLGSGATIGAGAVVLNNIEAGATAVGVPARQRIKEIE